MSQSTFDLRRKVLQLEAMYDFARALNVHRPESELLDELVHRAVAVLDASIGFIFSLDQNLGVQHLYNVALDERLVPEELIGEENIARVLRTREAVSIAALRLPRVSAGAALLVPMIAGDDVVGVIGVAGKEERGVGDALFPEDDLRFLQAFCAIGAVAIDNARNLEKLEVVRESLEDENRSLRERVLRDYSDRLMIGDSPRMQRVIDLVARVATSQASVLLRGESGTGKEMVARLIHGNSPRRDKPFVAINCAALPETLLESELFGIERGVATGVEGRAGRFELARGGTVFLDEIGDIPISLQAKLLRVLQEREVEKLGGRRRIPVDVRILTATHRDLEKMIDAGQFRSDLYYRLRVVEITLPPLRDRRDDIPKLVRYFLDKFGKREGREDIRISQEALRIIMRYPFPGNVRELENLIEGAVALAVNPVIDPGDLMFPGDVAIASEDGMAAGFPTLRELERRYFLKVLSQTEGNISQAARIMGIDRKTLYRWKEVVSQNVSSVDLKYSDQSD